MNGQLVLSLLGIGLFGGALYRVWAKDASMTKLVDETEGKPMFIPTIYTEEFIKQSNTSIIDQNVPVMQDNIIFASGDPIYDKLLLIQEKQKAYADYNSTVTQNFIANNKDTLLTYNKTRPSTTVFTVSGSGIPNASYVNN